MSASTKPEKLYDLAEMASMLSLSLKTVRKYAAQRRFPVVKLGRRVAVRESVILALQERGTQPANANMAM